MDFAAETLQARRKIELYIQSTKKKTKTRKKTYKPKIIQLANLYLRNGETKNIQFIGYRRSIHQYNKVHV